MSTSTCQKFPDYPVDIAQSVGGLSFGNVPLVCGGGYLEHSECNAYEDNNWKPSASMTEPKRALTITKSPFLKEDYQLIISGGYYYNSTVNTTEALTEEGWKRTLPQLPFPAEAHCMTQLNSTSVITILGQRTFILLNLNEGWVAGPLLNYPRYYQSCARIRKNKTSFEFSVIVVGGDNGTLMTSTEILDNEASIWQTGPDLPFGIDVAELIEDSLGGIILIGGYSAKDAYLDSLFRLDNAEAQWEELPQKLSSGRNWHAAFLIPDYLTNCTII
jgi:hypothetical protein